MEFKIKENVVPFIIIGISSGLVFRFEDSIKELDWLTNYLEFAKIPLDLKADYLTSFGEHIAPVTLTYSLIFTYLLAIFHRIIWGEVSAKGTWVTNNVIKPIASFASNLAIAMLGLLIGICIASIGEFWKYSVAFALATIYPLAYLLLLRLGVGFVYDDRQHKINSMFRDYAPRPIKSRAQGLYMLIIGSIVITFHSYITVLIDFIGEHVFGL
jgi:hypothetical protein